MSCLRPLGDDTEKSEAIFAASQECGLRKYVTVQELKGLKCAVVCYFQDRIFNPTSLLNHEAPSTELMQMWAI